MNLNQRLENRMQPIFFNKPHLTGKEATYIQQAVQSLKLSGNGDFTKRCHEFFEKRFGFRKCLLTSSCTDALEMAALLVDIQPGDEVIVPSYTFVSTANAFVLRGAKIVFCDSRKDNPGMDEDLLEQLITPKTKAIIPVHFAGVACDMDKIMSIAGKYNLFVIEDAAQAIDNYYLNKNGEKKALGSIGHLSAFSFHETKNIISGEGGMLVINDERFVKRAEILWEKGTNRAAFWRGEIDKYGWVDVGSSFLPSEITAAFLFAQIENLDVIQQKRLKIWNLYDSALKPLSTNGYFKGPKIETFSTNNAHMYYLICRSLEERTGLINHLRAQVIHAVFHYQSLHKSQFFEGKHDGRELQNSDKFTDTLVRLPFYYELAEEDISRVCKAIQDFFKSIT